MKVWYSCKVKHNKEVDEGMLKQVTDVFLLDAISYTDAESRLYEICEQDVHGEFTVAQITKTNITEVIHEEYAKKWFKSKVVYKTVDGDNDRETTVNLYLLVSADHVKQAFEMIEGHLASMLVPYDIPSISLTNILEVYPYVPKEIPENLRPLTEEEKEGASADR